jgi:hypothetical protein
MTKTLVWHALYDTTQNLSNILKNRSINTNFNTTRNFYTENNYVRFDTSYTMKSEPYELPEWYNTERDDDIVTDFINEYNVFYDSTKTIKMEMDEYDEYSKTMADIPTEEHSEEESDSEWSTVS